MQTFIYLGVLLFWAMTLAVFFMIGFFVSGKAEHCAERKSSRRLEEEAELERLRKEYSNFLAYDGTVQEEIE